MIGVLEGFGIIAVVIGVGYALGRGGVITAGGRLTLSRLTFYAASPALLFTVLAKADTRLLLSPLLVVSGLAAITVVVASVLVSRFVWRRSLGETTVAFLAAGYVNANNIGLPVAVYVLGNAAYSAPVILFQLLVFAPIALLLLDTSTKRGGGVGAVFGRSARNPLLIASLLGAVLAFTHVDLPSLVYAPLTIIGGAAVPLLLMMFGASLVGQRVLEPGSNRRDVLLATALKLVGMPIAAWALGRLFGLDPVSLHAAVVLATLPSAQNVLNYATQYDRSTLLARDTVLLTTIGSLPALVVVSVLLAP